MCHFINLVLNQSSDPDALDAILKRRHCSLNVVNNRHLKEFLKSDEWVIHPQGKHCDCGTSLGSFVDYLPNRTTKKQLDELRKKGWTERKIERWVEEREKINAREARIQEQFRSVVESEDADPDGWVDTIRQIINETDNDHVGVLLHWYGRSLDGEHIPITGRVQVSIRENAGPALYRMEEDKIYEVRA